MGMMAPTVAVMLFWLFVAVWLLVAKTPIALKPAPDAEPGAAAPVDAGRRVVRGLRGRARPALARWPGWRWCSAYSWCS
jgi:hypothetical protein